MSEMKRSHLGASSPEALNPEEPIVYEGRTPVTKKSTRPSRLRSDEFGIGWENFNGRIVFGTLKGNKCHLYTPDAVYVDGIDRICYVQPMPNCLLISEYGGSRGANYSGMYRILRELLLANQFEEKGYAFEIQKRNLGLFISILNQIIQNKTNSRYHLEAVPETDSIYTGQERHYFYKAYWMVNNSEPSSVLNPPIPKVQATILESLMQAEEMIRQTVEVGLACRQIDDLKEAEQKIKAMYSLLDRCSGFLSTYIDALQKAKQISVGDSFNDEETPL